MKRLYLLVLMLSVGQLAFAQLTTRKFNAVSQEELKMDQYDKYSDSEAVVLFDIGEVKFVDIEGTFSKGSSNVFIDADAGLGVGTNQYVNPEDRYVVQFTRTKRIKILKEEGLEYAEVKIPLLRDAVGQKEVLVSFEAYVHTLQKDGLVDKSLLTESDLKEEQVHERLAVKKFTFPDVKVGSVLEFRYVLYSPFKQTLPEWTFQSTIPTLYSQYSASMVPFYDYVYLAQGIDRFDDQYSKKEELKRMYGTKANAYEDLGGGFEFQDMTHTYVMKNVPAFKDVAFITSVNDYLMKLNFQLSKFHSVKGHTTEIMTTWEKLNEQMLSHNDFGRYMKKSKKYVKKILKYNVNLDGITEQEKQKRLIEYVKANFTWNGTYSRYASQSAKQFFEQRSGNSADINLFLAALLNYAEISAQPVLVSTRQHGKVKKDYPFEHYFNHVVVRVNGTESFLTDASEEHVPFNRLPTACINDEGLIVAEDNANWADLKPNVSSVNIKTIAITLDPEKLTAKTEVSVKTTEYEAFEYRNLYENNSAKLRSHFEEKGFEQVHSVVTENYKAEGEPYLITFEGTVKLADKDKRLEVKPFLAFPLQENKLTERTRQYVIDFIYAKTEGVITNIQIPEGYKVAELPENYRTDNELVEIKVDYAQEDGILKAQATYSFKKSQYKPEEYARIKNYMRMIVEKLNQPVVFEKASAEQARK